MDKDQVFDEPSSVQAENGEVTVTGPDSVAVKLTPEAAAETAERLVDEAALAARQKRLQDHHVEQSREALSRSLDILRKTHPGE